MVNLRPLFYQNIRQRRQSLDAALEDIADMQVVPTYLLYLFFFGLPLLFYPAMLTDFEALTWWARQWGFVWVGAAFIIYASRSALLAPAHVVGASVEAMEQAGPDEAPVQVEAPRERVCPLTTATLAQEAAETTVQALVSVRERWRRKGRWRVPILPLPRYLPLFSSTRDSSD